MAMNFALGEADAVFGFGQHVNHFDRRATTQVPHAVERFGADEPLHHVAQVVDERRIDDAEPRLKDVLAETGKIPCERRRLSEVRHVKTPFPQCSARSEHEPSRSWTATRVTERWNDRPV